MDVLLVVAHPDPRSFNGALTEVAVETLASAGHRVAVSDLYAMGFKAVADADDFTDRSDRERFRLDHEQAHAQTTGAVAPDIAAEQEKVRAAELLVLQFPMWWFGMPAILKGWVDRVFARGFAYAPGRKYDTGLLAGRTALVSVTTGTSAATYAPDGIDGSIHDILWPLHNGVLRYCGFDVLEPFVAHMPGKVGDEVRGELLDAWRARLMAVGSSPRLFFHPASDYGPDERLLPGVVALAVMSTAMVSLGIATGFERSYLVLKRLGATPLRRGELVTAKMLSVFVIELLQLVILVPLGLLLGWQGTDTNMLLVVPAEIGRAHV